MDPSDLVGERLFGEYKITGLLGKGTIGAVYLAHHDRIDKQIAIKVLHERSAQDDETVQRFQREALAVSLLNHPNIIRVLIFGRTDSGLLYLAMEYVEGVTLTHLVKEQNLDELRVIKIFKQLCSALDEAHEMGIIHRDLKPENILLTERRGERDFVKVLDFGMAKMVEKNDKFRQEKLSKSGIVYGTPAYVSPEQAQALDLDHRSDIYSLGCILYQTVTGRMPFPAETAVKMLSAHVSDELERPSLVAPGDVSPAMEGIILKAMAKEREDRFRDAREMFDALAARQRELEDEGNRPAKNSISVPPPRASPSASSPGSMPSDEAVRAIIWAVVGAAAMLFCVLAVVVAILALG